MLVHGIGSRRGAWDPVVEALGGSFDTIALDLPGFGESPVLGNGGAPVTVGDLTSAVADFIGTLGLSDPPHVVGNSLGGGIALELARRGVVSGATALSPIGFWSPGELVYGRTTLRTSRAVAGRLAPSLAPRLVRHAAGRAAMASLYYAHPTRVKPEALLADVRNLASAPGWDAALAGTRAYAFANGHEIRVPVTIAWGTRDRLLIPRQAERARRALPQARHVPLPGCGHVPMPDDPGAIAALLRVDAGADATLARAPGSRR